MTSYACNHLASSSPTSRSIAGQILCFRRHIDIDLQRRQRIVMNIDPGLADWQDQRTVAVFQIVTGAAKIEC